MSSLFSLTGQTAVVTGSSRGIGKAIATRLAEHGARVVISSRNLTACVAVCDELNEALGREAAIPVEASISDKAALERLVRTAEAELGSIDILVCNAASNPFFGPLSAISDAQFEKVLRNNILSNHWLIQLAAPGMQARGSGSIIVVSSIGAFKATENLGAYAISKAADLQLVRNLALELGSDGVRVNAIAPGLIRTDFAQALLDDPVRSEAMRNAACLGRIGEPDDIAGAAVFLAARAGAFVTGQVVVADGGATIR